MKEKINFYNDLLDELEFELVAVLEDNTVFKDLEEWDSMSVLIVINFFKKETGRRRYYRIQMSHSWMYSQ